MNTIGERVKYARELRGIKQEPLAEMIGTSQTTITNLEIGRNKTSKMLLEIAAALDVDPNWLATGKGQEPVKNQIPEKQSSYGINVTIKHLAAKASMGAGNHACAIEQDSQIGEITTTRAWAQEHLRHASSPSNVYIITGQGDSMLPTFKDGAPIFVDVGITAIKQDAIYVFEFQDHLYIKRITRHPGKLLASSDNSIYPPFEIPQTEANEIRVIGRVIGTCPFIEI